MITSADFIQSIFKIYKKSTEHLKKKLNMITMIIMIIC
jgi:hypothetical protein